MVKGNTEKKETQEEVGDFLKGIDPVDKHRSMAEMVYKLLKNAIINGDLKPGQRLVEQKLSDKMRVSRVPVREAIKRLEQYGFVTRLPVRGIIVKKVSEADINEAFGIRAALESYAAGQACEHVNDEMLTALESCIEASRKALKKGDMAKVLELNTQFHEMIYKAAQSDMLSKLINNFMDYIARYRKPLLSSKDTVAVSIEGHEAMVEAMRRGDKENVERIVKAHILQGRSFIMKAMGEGYLG
jgi:DNA-binding GntR family transcriptional regulator